uniref:RING-type E3 ubiquitin transferase n=1 Tax=Chrysotila carterae TaxID=13221 RepID=A0A7S4BM79_CHRCT|mmetsp:Transcript_21080/g.45864  ORF Transcript_21080/g.45864 Transcript_21080/m.45864 type:complete len:865 (-) Transcript_21080:512-3106(-)
MSGLQRAKPRSRRMAKNNTYVRIEATTPGQTMAYKDFTVLETLGQGGFGTVLLVRKNSDEKLYALKSISKRTMNTKEQAEQVVAECEALTEVRHPLIISLFAAFQDAAHVYFLLELAEGGTLMQQLQKREHMVFPEDWCRFYTAEVSLAIAHVHSKGFVYRDLKLENVLVSLNGHAKLADFGLATKMRGGNLTALAGTPHMLAPEVLSREAHGGTVDWWGVGLILAEMLTGDSPLGWVSGPEDISSLPNTFKKRLHLPSWSTLKVRVSPMAKKMVEDLLEVAPSKRMCCVSGLGQMQRCEWYKGYDWAALAQLKVEAPLAKELAELQKSDQGAAEAQRKSNVQDGELGSALCEAAMQGNYSEIRRMLAKGVSVNAGTYDQRTALHAICSAVDGGGLKMAKFLVEECGAQVNPLDRWGFTPLQDAVRSGRSALVTYLQSKGAHNGTAPYTDIFSAAAHNDVDLLRRLVASGVDVNQGDYDSRRALHVAASNGLLDVVVYLVDEAGAVHTVADRWGNTPLGNAMFAGQVEVVEFLQSRGATGAIQANNSLANNIFNLNSAAQKGDLDALRRMVTNGIDVNEGDYDSRRPLHVSAGEGLTSVVKFLIEEAKAEVNPIDRWGRTPLDDAIRVDKKQVVAYLRSVGGEESKDPKAQERLDSIDGLASKRGKKGKKGMSKRPSNQSFTQPATETVKLLTDPLLCPLKGAVFECPMVAEDGFTYEHAAFDAWLSKRGLVSPITGQKLPSAKLVPNHVVEAMLRRRLAKKERGIMDKPPPLKTLVPQVFTMCCVLMFIGIAVAALELLTFHPRDAPRSTKVMTEEGVTLDSGGSDFSFFYDDTTKQRVRVPKPEKSARRLLFSSGEEQVHWL